MIEFLNMQPGLNKLPFWLAQIVVPVRPTQPVVAPERAALVFSGPQFFAALISGVLIAFAFQFLLTNFGVAYLLGRETDSDSDRRRNDDSDSLGTTVKKISWWLGLATLITVSLAVLIASFLAVKLSLVTSPVLGAIIGLTIWGAYLLLLVWASSSAVGSLIGSVINTATSGFQSIVGTAAAALGAKAASNQVVSTAEAAAAAVGRQIGNAIDPITIRENLEDYLQTLRPPELDIPKLRREFENALNDPRLAALAGSEGLSRINRQTFVDLVGNNTALSKRDVNRIVDTLEDSWKQTVNRLNPQRDVMGELINYLKSAQTNELRSPELNAKLDTLIDEMRQQKQSTQEQTEKTPGFMQQAVQYGMNTAMGVLLGRTDLSDLDIEAILNRLKNARDQVASGASQITSQVRDNVPGLPPSTPNTIRLDVENYLLNSYPWHLNRETINHEFRQVIYDPEADPGAVRRQLERLSRSDFLNLLQQRDDITPVRRNEIADQLEAIRLEVLTQVQTAEGTEQNQDVRTRVENYLRNTGKDELNPEGIKRDFRTLIDDPQAGYDQLRDRLSHFDRDTFVQLLSQRRDITPEEAERIVSDLENTRNGVLSQAQKVQDQAKAQAEALWLNLESYLRNTGKEELNPDSIKRELTILLSNPNAALPLIRARLSRFDRDTLVKLLSQRRDLSEEQANQIIDQVQSIWSGVTHAPQIAADKTKEQYDRVTTAIADYLRNTGKDELNPEGIRRDLQTLFANPKEGSIALRERLSQVDRDTLVKLLSQRQDLSEEQVNQVIDQIQDNIRSIIRAPRRLAQRTQARIQDFQDTLEDYLRNTGKDALNPEGIKRDFSLLLHDPRTGIDSLGDRISRIDRDTLIRLLSQRPDISEAEATRIVDQIISVRDQFVEQVRSIQRRIQDVIDGIFARIRNYLNSLDRPELNYDGIKRDVRKLFDDPQAGFDAIRDRLGHFNRDTAVAILSSREDISEADANRIIDQIEGARNTVLQRAERIQLEAQRRVEDVKRQAAKSAEETRKAARNAAWWLFGTAFVSAICAAVAGFIAVPSL
ncbi:MFS transporter [Aerosakkonemataceae cyanobacterium BLCC-F50]|uniref:MFS transporter n=1 Tax=Floridaenema flaviceps BLCC-F50 TaxID=3153642 RepID=A0ABV4XZ37_9CYAN